MIIQLQQGLADDGFQVSLAKLCSNDPVKFAPPLVAMALSDVTSDLAFRT